MIQRSAALRFLETLSTDDWRYFTKNDFERIEQFVKSDGCTGVPEFYHNGCVLHDWCFRTHLNFYGNDITFDESNELLHDYICSKSWLGRFSPMAHWRWLAVKHLAERPWGRYGA